MDVLVTGRRCTITDDFRDKVTDRISSIERFKDRVIRVEVQLSAEPRAKQPDQAVKAEITLLSKGPVVRAVASAEDKTVAFEHALDRLKAQLRRAADRREKFFPATPLTLAQALDEMELVGHDFFLYCDADTNAPSVVYRRKAYDYGVIHLEVSQAKAE